jgi:SAM-dependent methyltransferase
MTTRVLEIGCGHGFNSYVLSKKNVVTGIDLSTENVSTASTRYPSVDFRVMDAGKLSFADDSFDSCYALDILEHVDHPERVVAEVARVLKPGGRFVVNVPAAKSEEWLLKLRPSYFAEIHHVRIFRGDDLNSLLRSHGFLLRKKKRMGFLQHIELFFLFTRKTAAESQLGVGNWRQSYATRCLHVVLTYFDPVILKTPGRYIPLWIITIPIGYAIGLIGNALFPKSMYYEFELTAE